MQVEQWEECAPTARGGRSSPDSLYSFHSSIDERIVFRNVHGRMLNSHNETYMLPADIEEHQRLDLQHRFYTTIIGALYPAPELVRRALAPRNGTTPAVLDVGTGSGSWAVDMAKEFPHAEVVGIDLVPPRVEGRLPPNCRFEIDDANLGFPHFNNCFDVVHVRAVSGGINDFPGLLQELTDCLRPGGVLLLADGDLQLFDENREAMGLADEGEPGFSWTHQLFFHAYTAMKARGASIDSPSLSPRWLQEIPSLADRGWCKIFLPIGPWPGGLSNRERYITEMLLANTLSHLGGMAPLLVSAGIPGETVDRMVELAFAELKEQRVRINTRWNFAWAVKQNPEMAQY